MGYGTRVWGTTAALAAVALFSSSVPPEGLAAPISNVKVVADYDKYAVTYDLKNGQPCPVFLMGSTDGGKTFDLQMEYVQGDVGPSVSPGKGKRILWEALKDFPEGIESIDITLDVVATCPPPAPAQAPAVAPVHTTAEYLTDLREEIEETAKLLEEKKQELEDLGRDAYDLREKYRDMGSEMDQIETRRILDSDVYSRGPGKTGRTFRTSDALDNSVKQYNRRSNEMHKISDQIDSNKSRRDAVIRLIREYESKLNELRKEEREVARGVR